VRAATRPWHPTIVLSRADDLAPLTVLDESDQRIELGALWADRTAILVFVRHFG